MTNRERALCAITSVGPDVPLANVKAIFAALREYGRYPLSWL